MRGAFRDQCGGITAAVTQDAQRPRGAEAFLVKHQSMRLQDRPGLPLQVAERHIVRQKLLRLGCDGIAPVVERL